MRLQHRLSAKVACPRLLLVALLVAVAGSVHAQTSTPAQLQAEIENLRIQLDVKQQRIEMLERELSHLRAPLEVGRERKIIDEIALEVSRIRGLRPKAPIEFSTLTPEVLNRLLDEEIKGKRATEFQGYTTLLKHLGLIPRDMDLEKSLRALLSEQVAGAYDDKTKKLYISDKFDLNSSIARIILAHEICHALQDQHFNLTSSPLHMENNDDRAMATLAVVEGDAMLLLAEYAREKASWKMLLELPRLLMMDQSQLGSAPPFIYRSLLFPYLQGQSFVMQSLYEGTPAMRNQVLRKMPRSTEQILHSEKYFGPDFDEPTEIALDELTSHGLIPAEGVFNNVAGEFGIQCVLSERLSTSDASSAAAGWDGDRVVFGGRLDGAYALAWLSVWDSESDAREFADALKRHFTAQRPGLNQESDRASPGGDITLTDSRGVIHIARKGERVACVHANDVERASRVLKVLLAMQVNRAP